MGVAGLTINWGTAPDWIAAIGTSVAAIIAVAVLGREIRAKTRRGLGQSSATRPAGAVLARRGRGRGHALHAGGTTHRTLAVIVRNGSEEPVLDCNAYVDVDPAMLVELADTGRRRLAFTEPIIPPGDMRRRVHLPPHGGPLHADLFTGCG